MLSRDWLKFSRQSSVNFEPQSSLSYSHAEVWTLRTRAIDHRVSLYGVMAIAQVDVVGSYTDAIRKLLEAARRIKPLQTIEPPLTYAGLAGDIAAVLSGIDGAAPKIENTQYAAVETAFRNIFYGLIVGLACS